MNNRVHASTFVFVRPVAEPLAVVLPSIHREWYLPASICLMLKAKSALGGCYRRNTTARATSSKLRKIPRERPDQKPD